MADAFAKGKEQDMQKADNSVYIHSTERKWFYRHCFPLTSFCKLLTRGHEEQLRYYPLALVNEGGMYRKDQTQTFDKPYDLRFDLIKTAPESLHSGALLSEIYRSSSSSSPSAMRGSDLEFDLDITDYNDLRLKLCGCRDKQLCEKCWAIVRSSTIILCHVLRNDFGFKHLLCIFSGRKGLHVKVCDERARLLSMEAK